VLASSGLIASYALAEFLIKVVVWITMLVWTLDAFALAATPYVSRVTVCNLFTFALTAKMLDVSYVINFPKVAFVIVAIEHNGPSVSVNAVNWDTFTTFPTLQVITTPIFNGTHSFATRSNRYSVSHNRQVTKYWTRAVTDMFWYGW